MSLFFLEGGPVMYPTLVFGFLFVAAGALHALRPGRQRLPLLVSLGLITVVSGTLGTFLGLEATFHYLHTAPQAEQLAIAAQGCAESLNNAILALVLVLITGLLLAIGSFRGMKTSAAS